MDPQLKKALRTMGLSLPLNTPGQGDSSLIHRMSHRVDPLYSILLSEHLSALDEETATTPKEFVSESTAALKRCSDEIDFLRLEIRNKVGEMRTKWVQRYTGEFVLKVMRDGKWLEEFEGGFRMAGPLNQKAIKDRFYQSFHIMVGDAEKIAVMTNSRLGSIQKSVLETWYKSITPDSLSKLLPTLEQMMRKIETDSFNAIRQSLNAFALHFFAEGLKNSKSRRFKHERFAIVRIGEAWNPRARYENNFQGYLQLYSELLQTVCLEMTRLSKKKWQLYLRGFSTGQVELFPKENSLFPTE